MIPKVQTWIVRFYKDGKVFHTEEVDTINKRFAYSFANEQSGYKSQYADRVTVALKRKTKEPYRESTINEVLSRDDSGTPVDIFTYVDDWGNGGYGLALISPDDIVIDPYIDPSDYPDMVLSHSGNGAKVIKGKNKGFHILFHSGQLEELVGKEVPVYRQPVGESKFDVNGEPVSEKAVSKKQQKFMGMVHAVKKGEMKSPSKEVANAAKSLSKKEAKKFASTKHKGLPEKKKSKKKTLKESVMNTQKKLVIAFINDMCDENYSSARKTLATYVDEKVKDKIKSIASVNTTKTGKK